MKEQVCSILVNQSKSGKYSPALFFIQITSDRYSSIEMSLSEKEWCETGETFRAGIPCRRIMHICIVSLTQTSTMELEIFSSFVHPLFVSVVWLLFSLAWVSNFSDCSVIVLLHLKHVFLSLSPFLSFAYLHNIFLFFNIDSTLLFNMLTFSSRWRKHTYL